jgi:hypothetical protein
MLSWFLSNTGLPFLVASHSRAFWTGIPVFTSIGLAAKTSRMSIAGLAWLDRQVRMKGAQTDVAEQLAEILILTPIARCGPHAMRIPESIVGGLAGFQFTFSAPHITPISNRRFYRRCAQNYETASRGKIKVPIGTLGA